MQLNKKTITAHMVVKNEEKWIWYSIMSVIDFVDKMIIFDTGSTDCTTDIIRNILANDKYKSKIVFEEKGNISKQEFYLLRQEQLDRTESDYFLVVDGDEIWYADTLREMQELINCEKANIDLVAVKFINCAGDVYHYRDFNREKYQIKGIVGSITVRLYSMNIKGLHCAGDYGVEGYCDYQKQSVQDSQWSIYVLNRSYLHMTFLPRSGARSGDWAISYRRKKFYADWDYKFANDFVYPEVFYAERPRIVAAPWDKRIGIIERVFFFIRKIKQHFAEKRQNV